MSLSKSTEVGSQGQLPNREQEEESNVLLKDTSASRAAGFQGLYITDHWRSHHFLRMAD